MIKFVSYFGMLCIVYVFVRMWFVGIRVIILVDINIILGIFLNLKL